MLLELLVGIVERTLEELDATLLVVGFITVLVLVEEVVVDETDSFATKTPEAVAMGVVAFFK